MTRRSSTIGRYVHRYANPCTHEPRLHQNSQAPAQRTAPSPAPLLDSPPFYPSPTVIVRQSDHTRLPKYAIIMSRRDVLVEGIVQRWQRAAQRAADEQVRIIAVNGEYRATSSSTPLGSYLLQKSEAGWTCGCVANG